MEKVYHPTREQQDYLEISSVLENAPYLLNEGRSLSYVGAGKSGTCNCASSKSSGGTCRALSLENSVSE
jgi:N-acetylmuramic acid 6-phosphate (MurNAc-6-P) etherase